MNAPATIESLDQAAMFLSEVTVVDHAYINHLGEVIGGSFLPSFKVRGDVDPQESVVVDFSTIKKDIKAAIDHKEIGFDHKLWIIPGYSNCDWREDEGQLIIDTPAVSLEVPANAVKFVESDGLSYGSHNAGRWFQAFLERELRVKYPSVSIECRNSESAVAALPDENCVMFRYVHGLKDSTSWGCQNVAHGHLSFIQAVDEQNNGLPLHMVKKLAHELNDTTFVFSQNLVNDPQLPRGQRVTLEDTGGRQVRVCYTTDRGQFYMGLKPDMNKVVILDTETTIEYLVNFAAKRLRQLLGEGGPKFSIYVSEGLSKGAYLENQ